MHRPVLFDIEFEHAHRLALQGRVQRHLSLGFAGVDYHGQATASALVQVALQIKAVDVPLPACGIEQQLEKECATDESGTADVDLAGPLSHLDKPGGKIEQGAQPTIVRHRHDPLVCAVTHPRLGADALLETLLLAASHPRLAREATAGAQ